MGRCERCKKAKATFHLTNIDRSGNKLERHLCDKCAGEEGLTPTPKASAELHEILENFIAGSKAGGSDLSDLTCDQCGISYVEFRNQSLLGCAADYDVFKEPLGRLLERAHDGVTHHTGKTPKSLGTIGKPQHDIQRLKRQLEEAVSAEDYERAAELRDRIRELESA